MIDASVFRDEWAILEDRFSKDFSAPTTTRYFQHLDALMETEDFQRAVRVIFAKATFFPSPEELVEAAGLDSGPQALEEWELALRVAEGERGIFQRMGPIGQKVVLALGGAEALGQTRRDQIRFVRAEFLRLFLEISDRPNVHLIGPEVTAESRRIVGEVLTSTGGAK